MALGLRITGAERPVDERRRKRLGEQRGECRDPRHRSLEDAHVVGRQGCDLAQDLGLGRAVAVKIVAGARLGRGATLRRFEREGRVMARLAHPGIVTVHDFGHIGEQNAYLAMERFWNGTPGGR